ncbi:alpha/beta hydrolase family protein [Cellulomonas sp. P4]|uniref:alpha/beta hydrolase family protein n=1 Tax=Cellulomonas sp. P4 TaxID=3142533 RepID=UPI0031BB694B
MARDDVPAELLDLDTPQGTARAHLHLPPGAAPAPGALVLGHGAGGGVGAPDLLAVTALATGLGLAVALVEQPYRVAGKRVGPRPAALDEAWCAAVAGVRDRLPGVPLVTGGRSAGARTACRTASATGAAGVLCLAFPTQPPGRPDLPSRLPELETPQVPVLVVQGATDPYGVPPQAPGRRVVVVRGDHGLKADLPAVTAAVRDWLPSVLPVPPAG